MAAPDTCAFCGHAESRHNINGCLEPIPGSGGPFGSSYCDCWGPASKRNNYVKYRTAYIRASAPIATQPPAPRPTLKPVATPAPPAQPELPNTQPLATLAQAIELIVYNAYEFAPILRGALLEYD